METIGNESQIFSALKGLKIGNSERLLRGMMYITGVRQIDIARKYNIDKTVLSKVLSGKRKSPKVRQAIANELHVPVEVLWPDGEGDHNAFQISSRNL